MQLILEGELVKSWDLGFFGQPHQLRYSVNNEKFKFDKLAFRKGLKLIREMGFWKDQKSRKFSFKMISFWVMEFS